MAAVTVTTANRIHVVESIEQIELIAAEAILAGSAVRLDTSTGKATNANGSSAGEARAIGIATRTAAAGLPVTVLRRGILDGFSSLPAFDAPVYMADTDATLDDGTGSTVDVIVGRVVPGIAELIGDTAKKLLRVDL
jgi:hypothetical protein